MGLFDNLFPTYLAPLISWLNQPGYLSLFAVSFLASTLLPLGSEWLLVMMVTKGYPAASSVGVATLGNTLGACTTWLVGRYGGGWLMARLFRISDRERQRAEDWYRRYGAVSLLFSWLPVVGDPLCLVGGLLRINPLLFMLLVAAGKLARYAAVAWLTVQVAG